MPEPEADSLPHFLAHSEVVAVFDSLGDFFIESDRGAVVLAAEHVSNHLERLFRAVSPAGFGKKRQDRLLEYPGALSSFSARAGVALLCGFIDMRLAGAIGHLRALRNNVAHSPHAFRLRDHWAVVSKAFDLADGMPQWINRTTLDLMVRQAVANVLELQQGKADEEVGFKDADEVLDHFRAHPEVLAPLDARLPRVELGLATVLMCALIVQYREREARRRNSLRDSKRAPEDGDR
jgi:hypothetical protein